MQYAENQLVKCVTTFCLFRPQRRVGFGGCHSNYPKGGNEDVKSNFYTRQGVKSNKIIVFAPERV